MDPCSSRIADVLANSRFRPGGQRRAATPCVLDRVEAVAQTTLNSSASFGRGTAQLGESVLGHEMGRLAEMAPISLVLSHHHRWHHVPRLYATASVDRGTRRWRGAAASASYRAFVFRRAEGRADYRRVGLDNSSMDPLSLFDRLAAYLRQYQFRVPEWAFWLAAGPAVAGLVLAIRSSNPLALCFGVATVVIATGIYRWRWHRRRSRGGLVVARFFAGKGAEGRQEEVQRLIWNSLRDKLTEEEARLVVHELPVVVGADERDSRDRIAATAAGEVLTTWAHR